MPTFTADWFTHNIPHWRAALAHLKEREARILEIGSYEGRSALFFLDFLPRSRVTCIDPFYPTGADATQSYETRFDANMAPFGDRVRKIKERSVPALDRLACGKERFDVLYIDGDHTRGGVFADTVLGWPLLDVGGILIWDDYLWERDKLPAADRPQEAIERFMSTFAACVKERHRGYQVIVEKTAEWPPSPARPK